MSETLDIVDRVARLEGLLQSRFGAKRGPLAQRAARLGRWLPKSVQRDLREVSEAAHIAAHPKLGLRLDRARVTAAAQRAEDWLEAVDASERRRGRLLGLLGALVFNLLLVAVILLALLRWRGFV